MKILLDECVPRGLRLLLVGHEAQTVQHMGWSGKENGDLLAAAESSFDCFVTADKNLRYQQNLATRKIAIVELPSNQLDVLQEIVPKLLELLPRLRSNDYIQVDGSGRA